MDAAPAHNPELEFADILPLPPLQRYTGPNPADLCSFLYCTPETARETVERYGVAIVTGVIPDEECLQLYREILEGLQFITKHSDNPLIADDPSTHKNYKQLSGNMLLQCFSVAHIQACWKIRQDRRIVRIFCKLYGIEDPTQLLVSTDGIAFMPGDESAARDTDKKLHSDQRFTRFGHWRWQSWFTCCDVQPGDATLEFLLGSHLLHEEFARHFFSPEITKDWPKKELDKIKKDWYQIAPGPQMDFYADRGCPRRRIACPKGSLVIWDSRTIHAGVPPLPNRPHNNPRCVVYVCYALKEEATEKQLKRKRELLDRDETCSHDPIAPRPFAKRPYNFGNGPKFPVDPLPKPELSPLGKSLAGLS